MKAFFRSKLTTQQNRSIFRISLLLVTSLLSIGALIFPLALRPSTYDLKVGDLAVQDIQAPESITYTSDVLTEQARVEAERMVEPRYLPADPAIARRQIERLRQGLNYITSIRSDTFASPDQKIHDLSLLQDLPLSEEIRRQLIELTDARWEIVQQESLNVIEQLMRRTIREDQISEVQRSIPQSISFSLPEDQSRIVENLVRPLIAANSLYSPEQTEAARAEARAAVTPITRTYIAGETIVRSGQVITPVIWEALQEAGVIMPESSSRQQWAAAALVSAIALAVGYYFKRRHIAPLEDLRGLLLTAFIFLFFLYTARLLLPNHAVIPYIFPLATFGMTVGSLYTLEAGIIFSLALSVLAAFGMQNALDLTLFYVLTSFTGILVLYRGRRVASFLTSGLLAGAVGGMVILAYRLPDNLTDWIGLATLVGASMLNGLLSASITLLLQYLFAQVLGLTTGLQLLDLSRPDHPLLQFMLQNAPGTYQHSLQVANLAEQGAKAIGADVLLTRVGAIYHDAGKALNASFFVENQVPGNINSHEDMDPAESAAIIIRHVHDGVHLARRYRLPPRLQDFMREHHGTMMTRYQYNLAVQRAGGNPEKVDPSAFTYPGPRPQSRETALLMLADGTEARARAEIPQGEEELRKIIRQVIDYCQRQGQLDDTTLTLKDLSTITESFVNTLRNTYHPRIKYPEPKTRPAETTTSSEAQEIPVSTESA